MKISAALIVKNEKDHIQTVLESLKGFDEIVVCDTGSVDNTVELAKQFTDNVFTDYRWNDDFAEARNHALSKCTGDWILSIDADEVLEEGGLEKIKAQIATATEDQLHFSVKMTSKGSNQVHMLPRLFRNNGTVKWVGTAHENLSPIQANLTDIVITYGYSTAHNLDPDRMFRILDNLVNVKGEKNSRNLYYLAREYYYKRDYKTALEIFAECVLLSTWIPEKSDALLYMSRCAFYTNKGDEARGLCLEAIKHNPDFKEALLFMAQLHYEPFKHKWERLASVATSEDVLFVRI